MASPHQQIHFKVSLISVSFIFEHGFSLCFPLVEILAQFQKFILCAVKYVNPITKLCIIRASREEYQKVWASITMVRSVGSCPVVFNLLDLSGEL